MTSGDNFRKYHQLKAKLEKELKDTEEEHRYKALRDLYRRCFPTKEQVIQEVERFYAEEA
jgi:hypothetical protein